MNIINANTETTRFALLLSSVLGFFVCATNITDIGSGGLSAILFLLAGLGFAGVAIYYLIVREGVENNK